MNWKKYLFFTLPAVIFLPATAWIIGYLFAAHRPVTKPDQTVQTFMVNHFKNIINGRKNTIIKHPHLNKNFPGPFFLNVYCQGKSVFSCQEEATPLQKAIQKCTAKINGVEFGDGCRIRVDLTLAQTRMIDFPLINGLLFLPGIEGLAAQSPDGERAYLLPDEMFQHNWLREGKNPLKFIKQLKVGVDLETMTQELANRLQKPVIDIYRVKLLSLVDSVEEKGKVKEVLRANTKSAPPVNKNNIYQAAIRGGDYMLNSIVPNRRKKYDCAGIGCRRKNFFRTDKGQFLYQYNIITDKLAYQSRRYYNLPRHAGTTYALANLYRLTGLKRFKEGASKAISYLKFMASGKCKGDGFRCVANGNRATLGSSALALVAIAEYRLATDDKTYDELGRDLADFLVFMQRKDGSFRHIYHVKQQKPDEDEILLYYSGEASFALAKSYKAWNKKIYLQTAEKGVDWLTGPGVQPLPFHFAFGEEHWTCQAARELWPQVKKEKYLDFCLKFAKYIKRQQWDPGESAFPDFTGIYGFTPFIPPHINGAGSRSESNVSVYELALLHGKNVEALKAQIKLALSSIIRHQRRDENCWLCPDKDQARGAVPATPVDLTTRIDTVQHTTSGLIRAWKALYK
ncbi:MAG: hypothetical protein PF689_07995 [Deltaproteobacteria bacterium]|jgi:hypothetical protein|nr:hypothetical protein [Deltaproteobacteria bacterium]